MLACYTRFVLVTIYVCRSRGSTKRVFSQAVSLLCTIFQYKIGYNAFALEVHPKIDAFLTICRFFMSPTDVILSVNPKWIECEVDCKTEDFLPERVLVYFKVPITLYLLIRCMKETSILYL